MLHTFATVTYVHIKRSVQHRDAQNSNTALKQVCVFQMLLRGVNAVGYTSYADNVVNAFVKEARVAGVDIFRVFDSLNYIDNLRFGIDSVHRGGGVAEGTICYTGDVSDPTKKKVHAVLPWGSSANAC